MSRYWIWLALVFMLAGSVAGRKLRSRVVWPDGDSLPIEWMIGPVASWAAMGLVSPYNGDHLQWFSLGVWGMVMLGAGALEVGSAVVWGRVVRARKGQRVLPLPHTAVVMAWSGTVGLGLLSASWFGMFLWNQMLSGRPVVYGWPQVWLGVLTIMAWMWLMFMRRHFRWSRWVGMVVGVWILFAPIVFAM